MAGLGVLNLQHRSRDCGGNLDGQERADEVEHAGEQNRHLRLESAGGDRGGHGVAGVVEPVREVEGQCRDDQQHQDDHLCAHGANSLSSYVHRGKSHCPRSQLPCPRSASPCRAPACVRPGSNNRKITAIVSIGRKQFPRSSELTRGQLTATRAELRPCPAYGAVSEVAARVVAD